MTGGRRSASRPSLSFFVVLPIPAFSKDARGETVSNPCLVAFFITQVLRSRSFFSYDKDMPVARTNLDIPWTWEHRIGELRLGEIEVIVSVDCAASYPIDPADGIDIAIDAIAVETMQRNELGTSPRFVVKRRWLPDDDDLVALMRKDLTRDERFIGRVHDAAFELARQAG